MGLLRKGTMGLVLVVFGNQGSSWSVRQNGKLGQELHHSVKKEWLDFTLGGF
jgi:hypothetical protein